VLITISGPEKSGKTSLCTVLQTYRDVTIRHCGPIADDTEFLAWLQEDVAYLTAHPGATIVWDRSYVCDHVYSSLLHRPHRFGNDPWLAEWLYGRAVQSLGMGVIMAGPSAEELARRRDDTDLPVSPSEERAAYVAYGRRFGYDIYKPAIAKTAAEQKTILGNIADTLMYRAHRRERMQNFLRPPLTFCGRGVAQSVVITDDENDSPAATHGGWLPGTGPDMTQRARHLGPLAFSFGWMPYEHTQGNMTWLGLRAGGVYAATPAIQDELSHTISGVMLFPTFDEYRASRSEHPLVIPIA